jgi:hypothetical protein
MTAILRILEVPFGSKAEHCRPIARERPCRPHPQQERNEPNWFANLANRPEATSP